MGMFSNIGLASCITENAIPVENAANAPHAIPNPGMNIGSASNVLWTKYPNSIYFANQFTQALPKLLYSLLQKLEPRHPIANDAEKIPRKIKK